MNATLACPYCGVAFAVWYITDAGRKVGGFPLANFHRHCEAEIKAFRARGCTCKATAYFGTGVTFAHKDGCPLYQEKP